MKKYIPLVSLALIALALMMTVGGFANIFSRFFRGAHAVFAWVESQVTRGYWKIIDGVDGLINARGKYAKR